ncbi:MAG: hypothetical protein KY475_03200 [Planctomycetes bacterium]|nr:hypothetical protein [Planctomycetota bacterium]
MRTFFLCLAMLSAFALPAASLSADDVYPTAIFAFQERGSDVKGLGAQVADLLFAGLVVNPNMYLVDREEMQKILQEQELNVSGAVNAAEAVQVGQLTGAKLIVAGSVLQSGDNLYLVAKVIGTETTRVVGASVKGGADDELDALAMQLAEAVAEAIEKNAEKLIAKPESRDDRIAALKEQLGEGKRPAVRISIDERHVGQATVDPAAETEMMVICKELDFDVIDPKEGDRRDADVHIVGEGFSEFTARVGNLAPVKARLEVKALDAKTGKVLAVDRQTSVAVDLNEQIAGKSALQEASAEIAQRLLPKLVKQENGDQ